MKNKKVVEVWFNDARNLDTIFRIGDVLDHLPGTNWTRIAMEVPGELEISSKIEDKVEIFTAKLTFREICRYDYPPTPAFLVRLADNTRMVIGSSERPYPVVTESQSLSSSNSNSQLRCKRRCSILWRRIFRRFLRFIRRV